MEVEDGVVGVGEVGVDGGGGRAVGAAAAGGQGRWVVGVLGGFGL